MGVWLLWNLVLIVLKCVSIDLGGVWLSWSVTMTVSEVSMKVGISLQSLN